MTGHDYFRALLEVATVINSSLEPTVVLHKITEQTAKAMNCKASTLRLLDRTGKLLLASAAWGLSSGYMRKGPVEVAKSGLDGEVLKGKLIHLRDACSDGRFQYPESAKAEGLVSVLSAPLMVNGSPVTNVNAAINQTAAQAFNPLTFAGDSGPNVTQIGRASCRERVSSPV